MLVVTLGEALLHPASEEATRQVRVRPALVGVPTYYLGLGPRL